MTKEELAEQYADEIVINNLRTTIMNAYQQGYDTAKLEYGKVIDVDNIRYFDLGLPSGTCWSFPTTIFNYGSYLKCISFEESQKLNIPTKEQWMEILEHCRFIDQDSKYKSGILGPSGKETGFEWSGTSHNYLIYETRGQNTGCEDCIKFWLKSSPDSNHTTEVMKYKKDEGWMTDRHFIGFVLPVFLVKNKSELQIPEWHR